MVDTFNQRKKAHFGPIPINWEIHVKIHNGNNNNNYEDSNNTTTNISWATI